MTLVRLGVEGGSPNGPRVCCRVAGRWAWSSRAGISGVAGVASKRRGACAELQVQS